MSGEFVTNLLIGRMQTLEAKEKKLKELTEQVEILTRAIRAADRELSALPMPQVVAVRRDLWDPIFDQMNKIEKEHLR